MKLRRYFLILGIFVSLTKNYAQNQKLEIGQLYRLESKILQENRSYWVNLPSNYENEKTLGERYSVMIVLDGETNFLYSAATVNFLARGMYASMPQTIVVGIHNTDRTRDLTPSNATISDPSNPKQQLFGTSGGADNFLRFINEELLPLIESQYATNGYKILVGHSFGGLFTVYTLLKSHDSFDAYLAFDPSLWWNQATILNTAQDLFAKPFLQKKKNLYIALANNPESEKNLSSNHERSIRYFTEKILSEQKKPNLRWDWKFYKDDDHGTVPFPALYEGLRFIFRGFQLPIKEIPQNPSLVKKHLELVHQNTGYYFTINRSLQKQLSDYCSKMGIVVSAEFWK